MSVFTALVRRNAKMFFKDKGMFFTSLITPLILLLLYVTFLANVYRSSFMDVLPLGDTLDEKLLNALVGGQLISSLLAVSCVTVSFCSNLLMVQDKFTGARADIAVSPVKGHTMALAYFVSTVFVSMLICTFALCVGLIYLVFTGFYMTAADVLKTVFIMFLLVMLGTALSSIINCFLSTQGQLSAVGSIVSSTYGFICGAYMPISNFPTFLQNTLSFLPTTYGTALLRNTMLRGAFEQMSINMPHEVVKALKDGVDCNIYCFGNALGQSFMLLILVLSVAILVSIYTVMNISASKKVNCGGNNVSCLK